MTQSGTQDKAGGEGDGGRGGRVPASVKTMTYPSFPPAAPARPFAVRRSAAVQATGPPACAAVDVAVADGGPGCSPSTETAGPGSG
jgi:hypothetical protein